MKSRVAIAILAASYLAALPACDTPKDAFSDPSTVERRGASKYTHVVSSETAYYRDGPQQGRPHDGMLFPGTRVTVVEGAGSYCRVRTEAGLEVWVATDSLRPLAP